MVRPLDADDQLAAGHRPTGPGGAPSARIATPPLVAIEPTAKRTNPARQIINEGLAAAVETGSGLSRTARRRW
jgi:hypothetical protein